LKNAPYGKSVHRQILRSGDPIRYSAIALALEMIKRDGLSGAYAELGVYRGDLTEFICQFSDETNVYLFDTFAGFPDADRGGYDRMFSDTSEQAVRRRVGHAHVIFRAGYFPDTAKGLEDERFSFVSLDADLYKPMLAGLEFFVPRLTKGGYLFLHDYHSPFPVAKAVADFGLSNFIELPDKGGSLIMRKP
jgi:O-methyltransferase